jgi:uncharacterized repeat protein (TIGR01451 family)
VPDDHSNADGYYLFPNLTSDTYTVTVRTSDLPAGIRQSFEYDGSLNHQTTVAITTGQNNLDVDFGYVPNLSVDKRTSGGGIPLNAGDTITYTIVVSNPSPATVTGVTISDTIPANTAYVAGSVTAPNGEQTRFYDGSAWGAWGGLEPATVRGIAWRRANLLADSTTYYVAF